MTVTFISNYINHHQIPFSNACYGLLGNEYHFIQCEPMEKERLAMGWNTEGEKLPYVHFLYEEEALCHKLVMESDVLLAGWSGHEELVQERLKTGKLTIRVSERLYREGQWKAVSPKGLVHKYREHTRYRKSPAYLLCAGAYVPSDFHLIHAYPGKMFKWGYFPETRYYDKKGFEGLKKEEGRADILWAGRFIPLKHAEYMVRLAKDLQGKYDFHIHMVGSGQMEEELKELAKEQAVEGAITFYGFKTPDEVRDIMEKCHVYVFTSNHLEGWGAVVNEAMNSGCAVVANVQAGAIPYLIRHGENGLAYPAGSYEKMKEEVCYLLEHPGERKEMGRRAYETIVNLWNADHGARELLRMVRGLKEGRIEPAPEGPLSAAPVVRPGKMYEYMLRSRQCNGKGEF